MAHWIQFSISFPFHGFKLSHMSQVALTSLGGTIFADLTAATGKVD